MYNNGQELFMVVIEIFAERKTEKKKVACKSCPLSCDSRDQVVLTPSLLMAQIQGVYLNQVEVIIYDYEYGHQDQILDRLNQLYKENNIRRVVNKILIGPLMPRIWPAIAVDGHLESEGALLDLHQIQQICEKKGLVATK